MPILIDKLTLPIDANYDSEYEKKLYDCLFEYPKCISNILQYNPKSINSISENIDLINKALQYYYNGKIWYAYDCIKKILEKYISSPYIVAPIDENYAFRGLSPESIRPKTFDSEECVSHYQDMLEEKLSFFRGRIAAEKLKIEDMFHIPFNKRGCVATQRFSISGIPCIYLATTTYGCWLELGTPESDIFQVSSYKIPTNLRILNLCIQWNLINGECFLSQIQRSRKNVYDLFEIFPLIIATSFHIRERNRTFKSEYIISQIVMQVCNDLGIDGVAYLSKKVIDNYAYPQAVNLAIAVPYTHNNNFSYWNRANEVFITKPVRFSDFCNKQITNEGRDSFSSYINKIYENQKGSDIIIAGDRREYTDTKFSAFDEYLVSQTSDRFTDALSENGNK